ncbi:unnamed protein product [Allacma fusca]|uniref:Uncharacterized protein n=1 Tax=Allacma fusca TaxID=39272 RepID=A0A8J2PUM1_9HEXA|nr:unnamed protein product [Allacma fusca]
MGRLETCRTSCSLSGQKRCLAGKTLFTANEALEEPREGEIAACPLGTRVWLEWNEMTSLRSVTNPSAGQPYCVSLPFFVTRGSSIHHTHVNRPNHSKVALSARDQFNKVNSKHRLVKRGLKSRSLPVVLKRATRHRQWWGGQAKALSSPTGYLVGSDEVVGRINIENR